MKILLDTNALLWQLGISDSGSLGPKSITLIKNADVVYVSSISIFEMQMKTMLGKLNAPVYCRAVILDAGNELLDFGPDAADLVRIFPQLVRHDPFDRILLAQAKNEQLTLLTADKVLLDLGFDFVRDASI